MRALRTKLAAEVEVGAMSREAVEGALQLRPSCLTAHAIREVERAQKRAKMEDDLARREAEPKKEKKQRVMSASEKALAQQNKDVLADSSAQAKKRLSFLLGLLGSVPLPICSDLLDLALPVDGVVLHLWRRSEASAEGRTPAWVSVG